MEIATYRAAYMTSLLESGGIPVKVEDSVKNMVGSLQDDGEPCPAPLDQLLRPYQMRGFMWMQALDRLRMGGILADDMGLGKTLQVITLLLWAKRRGDQNAASIVVAPTSLVYNWMAEIAKFAPELRCVAGEGTQAQRAQTIARLSGENRDVDVYLTSYPLIRRDIGLLSKVPFRFAILDEAQYIKNAMSVGAGAVKQLKAQTRLALTGTPMENHPGELWSIFDFVLPGYLNSFAQFMHRFGTGEEADVLRSRIRPFLLRRLKGDVLRELPEKVEITLTADMTEEQRRVYQASLLRLRPQVEGMFSSNNRIEMLAAITELRQICGHPSLVLPSYAASSGKLDLLLDVLPGSLEAGHRALIFSQFTRMLKILQRRLEAVGISCMYLDGETPPKRRIEMVQQFNAGEGQVFLISLKADGTPSVALERRLTAALEEYRKQPRLMIVCGAQGSDEPRAEGDVMRDWLIAHGVAAADIEAETDSFNTRQNLGYAQSIMDDRGLTAALIVTSDYHVPRALALCEQVGIIASGKGSPSKPEYFIKNHLREGLSWIKFVWESRHE